MKLGKQTVRITNAGMTGEGDRIQPFIELVNDDSEKITWYGNLKSEASRAVAMKTVTAVGFSGAGWDEFNLARINHGATYETEIENHTYNGKTTKRVKYIGGIRTMKLASSSDVKAKLAHTRDEFAVFRAKNGVQAPKPTDDIPF